MDEMINENIKEDIIFKYCGRSEWKAFSKKTMKKKYPEGGYKILGEVIKKKGKSRSLIIPNEDHGGNLYVQPLKTYSKLLYRRYAYVYCRELDGYVIIKKNNALLWLLGLLGTLLTIGLITWGLMNIPTGPDIDPNVADFTGSVKRSADMDDSKILIPAFGDWKMIAGTDKVYMALSNPENNPCYFSFDIVLDATGETLFKTKLIPPGKAITTVQLPQKLDVGVYPITVKINSYSLDNPETPMNGGESATNIIAVEPE